jgi:hypothetical protein
MNVLFLIGNGFDLNVGLKTRFKDVLEAYLKREDTDPRLCKFKEGINQNFENWSDFEKQMGVYTEKFTIETIDDYCFCIRDFREFLVAHLKKEESQIDYTQYKHEIVSVFKKSIQNFYKFLQPSDINIFRTETKTPESIYYNFITFNYTHVLDKCLELVKNDSGSFGRPGIVDVVGQILHVHGTTEESLIMGVDNVSQIANENIAIDKKLQRTIIKPVINDKLKNLNNQTGQSLVLQSNIICVFGLSLGETDKRWWELLGHMLKSYAEFRLILYVKEDEWNLVHPEDSIEKIEEVLDKAFNAMNISPTESISDRIYIGFNTDMFKIDLTKKEKDSPTSTRVQVVSSRPLISQN